MISDVRSGASAADTKTCTDGVRGWVAGARAQTMMLRDPALLHSILDHFADAIAVYAIHQIDCGAQVVQLFDSWAHHLSPSQFSEFSMPYAQRVLDTVKAARPDVRSVPLPLPALASQRMRTPPSLTEPARGLRKRQVTVRRVRRPQVPLIFHANGGTGKLERIAAECKADVIGLDWATDMAEARRIFGA